MIEQRNKFTFPAQAIRKLGKIYEIVFRHWTTGIAGNRDSWEKGHKEGKPCDCPSYPDFPKQQHREGEAEQSLVVWVD